MGLKLTISIFKNELEDHSLRNAGTVGEKCESYPLEKNGFTLQNDGKTDFSGEKIC